MNMWKWTNIQSIKKLFLKVVGHLAIEGQRMYWKRFKQFESSLEDYVEGAIYYGIKTGLNDAFVIDRLTKTRLIAEDPKSAEVIKPFLAGKDVKRYSQLKSDNFLIYIPWHFPLQDDPTITGSSKKAENEFKYQISRDI